ncbi:MAG: hypothetical protein EBR82_83610 [Caulobacteraceae bacterium]|nr:hypothetical protein [Caulobacteraceae bacterium]
MQSKRRTSAGKAARRCRPPERRWRHGLALRPSKRRFCATSGSRVSRTSRRARTASWIACRCPAAA